MVDFKKLARNMDVRKKAEGYKKLIDEKMAKEGLVGQEQTRAWEVILNEVFGRDDATEKMSVTPMSYNEARAWYHKTILDFGKHKGKKIEDVPFTYLEWLSWQPDFRRDLNRFMSSDFVRSNHYMRGDHGEETED